MKLAYGRLLAIEPLHESTTTLAQNGLFTSPDPNNAVAPGSLALFLALLSAFIVVLTLRARLPRGPSQQATMAFGSTPDPIGASAKAASRLPRL